jgi:hypothetical protein
VSRPSARAQLDWSAFAALPGDPRLNFERLWRGAVVHAFAKFGNFTARVQQPGVEFQLAITDPRCPIGNVGETWGWQTKYFDTPTGTSLTQGRKDQITDSIEKTEKHCPAVTDFVLVTRYPLTAGDQTWFAGLTTTLRLHQWSAPELDLYLVDTAALLREAYFGLLVLTPDRLDGEHELTTSEIRDRWIPQVHQPPAGEDELRRMLAQPHVWTDLRDVSADIERFADAVDAVLTTPTPAAAGAAPATNRSFAASALPGPIIAGVVELVQLARDVASVASDIHALLLDGQSEQLVGPGRLGVPTPPVTRPLVLRQVQAAGHPAAPLLVNLVARTREAGRMVELVESYLTVSVVTVVGDPGYGKTQLAATLSAATPLPDREPIPAGVLLLGRWLGSGENLNDLARRVTIAGEPVPSFEALVAALDAAAGRAGCRLPVVIDGLNEADRPADWMPLLRRAATLLSRYPSVLLVCTVREAFRGECIPPERDEIVHLDGFTGIVDGAVAAYFQYYKIEPGDAELPRELFSQPLTLRIFCEVANGPRERTVTAEHLPTSLTAMFTAYLEEVAERISARGMLRRSDVVDGLLLLGLELWTTRARQVPEQRARELLGDGAGRTWHDSLLNALQSEGILLRQHDGPGRASVSFVYDLLAGHLVAQALIAEHGRRLATVLAEPDTVELFGVSWQGGHPLASDILAGLAGGLPRAELGQLWQLVPDALRLHALLLATRVEAPLLDAETADALASAVDDLSGRVDVFTRLYSTRATPGHPLNATFLDGVLRERPVARRDLRWTEFLRHNADALRADAAALRRAWQEPRRSPADELRARWLMWTLTSTDRALRDAATAALHAFGRHDPPALFSLTLESLTIDDAWVPERMLAASYGVAMSRQLPDDDFGVALAELLQGLAEAYLIPGARTPTSHALIREYVFGLFAFARRYYPAAVPGGVLAPLMFQPGPPIEPLTADDPRRDEVRFTVRMDFGNYTLGRLFPDRRNYDDRHPGHIEGLSLVLGTVYAHGWREELFADVERRVEEHHRSASRRHDIERYGKKYAWIGLHNLAGLLADRGQPRDRLEVDIDPSFPQPPPPLPIRLDAWAVPAPADDIGWLRNGTFTVSDELMAPEALGDDEGPWLLAHAFLESQEPATGRRVFGLFNTVLVAADDAPDLLEWLRTVEHPGRDVIDLPGQYYTFAGELPWHDSFAAPEPGYPMRDVYQAHLRRTGSTLTFERMAHDFSWESYHSSENQTTGYVPSRPFSEAFDLRTLPGSLDQAEPDGRAAAKVFAAPDGFTGHLLYLRRDLVERFAGSLKVVTFGWGEREPRMTGMRDPSDEIRAVYQEHANVWRTIATT